MEVSILNDEFRVLVETAPIQEGENDFRVMIHDKKAGRMTAQSVESLLLLEIINTLKHIAQALKRDK